MGKTIIGKKCKMSIDGKEIKGMESFKLGEGAGRVEFSGKFKKDELIPSELKKGDPLKVYYDDTKFYDAIVISAENKPDGSQAIRFKTI